MGKKMKSAELKSIPQELILEIFSLLPVKSLMRYRCVSKFYNSLVSESNFVDIHHCRSMIRPRGRMYLVCINNAFYTTELKEDGKSFLFRIENFYQLHGYRSASSLMCVNGLVCAWRDKHHVAICNSSTREVRFLRCPKEFANQVCSIGFEPEEKKYKLWLTLYLGDGYTRNWVFTLDIDKSWRQTTCNAPFFPYNKRVCVNGVIFMLSYSYGDSPLKIVAFDVRAETFRTFTFSPPLPYNEYIYYNLIEVKGKLALLNYKMYSSEDMHLWVFGKAQNDDWKRHIIPCPSQWEGIDVKLKSYSRFMCSSCDGEIIFESITKSGSYICICYNITRESWREFEVETLYVKRAFDGIFCYVENLFPLGKLCNANLQD